MSERPDEALKSAGKWLRYAGYDPMTAQRALLSPPITNAACFHAQQAGEKALKAYLVWLSDERIPRTHDLLGLAELVVARGGETPPTEPVGILNDYAVSTRYPEGPEPPEDEAREAVELAAELVD